MLRVNFWENYSSITSITQACQFDDNFSTCMEQRCFTLNLHVLVNSTMLNQYLQLVKKL